MKRHKGISVLLWSLAAGALVRLLLPGLGAVCQCQTHPSTGKEHMDKAYHQKKYHVIRLLIGMMIELVPCLLAGALVMVVR